ncbi:MAG: ABC transporter ATP-binding protein [Chloroflexaceae bacterium]|nr:ABC transporter ATP-binding protein [Chloroflexaceae bacterium]
MVYQSRAERHQVLKGIDLEIPRGACHVLMGPSGSGKTTLVSILAGLLTPTAGQVFLLDREITQLSPRELTRFRREHLGFVFQGFNLFPALSAAENVEVAFNVKGIRGKAAVAGAQSLLDLVGLGDRRHYRPCDLSGGQKQRVAIARALVGEPEIIIADEPTAALDAQNGQAISQLLHHLAKEQGCTVLLVTHDPRLLKYADTVHYLEDGQIQPQDSSRARFYLNSVA